MGIVEICLRCGDCRKDGCTTSCLGYDKSHMEDLLLETFASRNSSSDKFIPKGNLRNLHADHRKYFTPHGIFLA